jgi:hypothetical protein
MYSFIFQFTLTYYTILQLFFANVHSLSLTVLPPYLCGQQMELVQNQVKWASSELVAQTLSSDELQELTITKKPWQGKEVIIVGHDHQGLLHIIEDVLVGTDGFEVDGNHSGLRIVARLIDPSSARSRQITVDIHDVRDAV